MPRHIDFTSSNGKTTIEALHWPCGDAPRGVVQLCHGMCEHIGRYDEFARFLNSRGFAVVGNNHLGHGASLIEGRYGYFGDDGAYNCLVEDLELLRRKAAALYPGLPYFLFGHSMGSFLVRTSIIRHPEKPDAVIISGTGHQPLPMVLGGLAMASAAVKLYGAHKIGNTLNNVAFGAYNNGYAKPRTDFDWLSRDTENVDKYIADPLCGFVPTVSLFRDMMSGNQR